MSVLQLFVTEDELDQILRDFAIKRDLRGALQVKDGYELYDPTELPSERQMRSGVYRSYLFPKSQVLPVPVIKETIMPRFMGWMAVDGGRLAKWDGKDILLMTTIHATERRELPFKPATWLRALKKQLAGSGIRFGVNAVNVVHGGGGPCEDIGYSAGALEMFKQGVLWRQMVNGYLEFEPQKQAD